ncbi:MAG TPA: HAD family hydrolase [Tepidisphaeraceae bacterium]|jgi:D-glycero-D-manno-heptose 1,7-bisphosphate phosphatase|nr:HAD family hydrolase [Tepidisphaeraceae bacterium]
MTRRAVFLDRDGVLIRTFVRDGTPHPPQTPAEVEILPGVYEALSELHDRGFLLLVVTNQPDVARGTQTREMVEQINAHLLNALPLDGVYVCYHDTPDGCGCRKPAPGLLLQAAREHHIDLPCSYMVGDRGSDIVAGAAAGCRTFLIERPYSRCNQVKPTWQVADLREAGRRISAECRVQNEE